MTARPEQYMGALVIANRYRHERGQIKKEVFKKEKTIASVIWSKTECLQNMSVFELLRAQKGWGPTRARKFLLSMAIGESKRIGQLTPRQKELICNELSRRALRSVLVI